MRPRRIALSLALAVCASVGATGGAWGQYQQDQPPAGRPAAGPAMPSEPKPIPPSRAEISDSAFKKLDAAAKGFVSAEDARSLDGFAQAFQQNDADRDGKLNPNEFRNAWRTYTGNE